MQNPYIYTDTEQTEEESQGPRFLGKPISIKEPRRKLFKSIAKLVKIVRKQKAWKVYWKELSTWILVAKIARRFIIFILVATAAIIQSVLEVVAQWLYNYITYLKEVIFGPISIYHNWNHLFNDFAYSSRAFYAQVEEEIERHKIPSKYEVTRVKLWEGSILSPRRLYLKIKANSFVMYICAAQYGRSYFFSWWQAQQRDILSTLFLRLISYIPFFGSNMVKYFEKQTFYRCDTANMFQTQIHSSILDTIDSITKEKGVKGLTAEERKPITQDMFKR